MASASIWNDNKVLKKWIKKNQSEFVDGNFNYNLTDLLSNPLLDAISKKIDVPKEYIYVGAGSSQLITVIVNLRIWNKVIIPLPEFGLYTRGIELNNLNSEMINCLTTEEFVTKLSKVKSSKNDLLCISSPRWFSGERFTDEQIQTILKNFKGYILIDEAYIAFSEQENGLIDLALENDKVMILRSFSKTYFASGFRLGYLVTKKKINGLRNTFIAPHSVSTYSARFAIKLLNDEKLLKIFKNSIAYMKKNRNLIYEELEDNNINIIKSEGNFISLVFKDNEYFEKCFNALKDLPGIQKFNLNNIMFIKIWISNEKFSKVVLERLKNIA